MDAIVHVVRCFDEQKRGPWSTARRPARDAETINLELIFADLESLDKRMQKAAKLARTDKSAAHELELMEEIKALLEAGQARPRP